MVGDKFVPLTIQTSVKFRDFEELYLLGFDKSLSNLANMLILRRSFQWCQQIFPNWSMSKAEKKEKNAEWSIESTPTSSNIFAVDRPFKSGKLVIYYVVFICSPFQNS